MINLVVSAIFDSLLRTANSGITQDTRKNLLQSPHNSNKKFVPFHKEKSESKHQDDIKKKQIENSRDVSQQSDIQIPNTVVGTASISAMDAESEICQSKNQECNLSRRESSDGTIQDFISKSKKKSSHINVTSTNHRDISVERSDIKAAPSSSSLKDEPLRKQNFVYKSVDKSSCSESKIVFPKDKSTSISAEKVYISVIKKCPSSENKSSTASIRYNENHCDSRISIDPSKDNDVLAEQEKKKSITEVKQDFSSVKTELIDMQQKCSYKSRNEIFPENNSSKNTTILRSRTYPKAKVENLTNEDASILEKHTQIYIDLESVDNVPLCQTSIKKDDQTKINLESKDMQTDNLIEINSKSISKRKISSESLDQNMSLIKIRKENKINTSSGEVVIKTIEISDEMLSNNEMLFDNEPDHTKQKSWENTTKCMIKERENCKVLKRERHRKEKNKQVKNIQEKLHKYFRNSFDPDTSESEEEREILLNYLKRRKQQFNDPEYDITIEEGIKDIFKRIKQSVYDISANNLQKDTESAMPGKIRRNNLRDCTVSIEKYTNCDATINEETEDKESISKRDIAIDNSQENNENIYPANACDSVACTKKDSMHDVATDKKIKGGPLIYEYSSSADSQKNMDIVSVEVKSGKSSEKSSECTEKYCVTDDATTERDVKSEPINTCDTSSNNLQKNVESATSNEAKFNNSCNSTASTEKYAMYHATTDEKIKNALICDTSANKQENIKCVISAEVKSDSCNSTASTGKYNLKHDVTTDEIKDGASCKSGISVNNSQESVKSAISDNIRTDNSNDSTVYVEKSYAMHDAKMTGDKEVQDGSSIYKCDMILNNPQENIKSKVPAKKQHENSSSIVDTENCKKSARAKINKDITLSTIEIDLDEDMSVENIHLNRNIQKEVHTTHARTEKVNLQAALANRQKQEVSDVESVDLAQCKNMQDRAKSNLELPIASAHESISDVGEEDSRDVLQNIENFLLTSNIIKDKKTIDQLSVTALPSEENFSEKKHDKSLSIRTNSSTSSSNLNCNDSHSLNSRSDDDDDNNSDIEVEIKIKPKLKSRVLRKFSLKAPWSAVNTCIKNLHTLKNDSHFLNKLLQMDHETSKKFGRKFISRSSENNISLDDKNVTVETEDYDIVCDSSPTKNNVNGSQQQQQNFQDYPILNESKNTIDCNQRERTESVNTTENSSESSKLACDTSNLGKQLQKVLTNDKQKTNEEQSRSNTILEETRSMADHSQGKENERVSSTEQKKTQLPTENNTESIKAIHETPNVGEQLSRTSSDATYKVRVRSVAELSCQCAIKSTILNASVTSKSACSAFCQSGSFQSALPQSAPLLSTPLQSAPLLSTPLQPAPLLSTPLQPASVQSAPLQPAPLQSAPLQPAPLQPAPLQPAPLQSTPLQPTPFQPAHSQLVPPQLTSFQPTRSQLTLRLVPPQVSPQSVSNRLSCDTVRHMPLLNRENAPVGINAPNINDIKNLIQITAKSICTNIEHCRNLIRSKFLGVERGIVPPENDIQKMCRSISQINQDFEKLKVWLCMKDVRSIITYVNQYRLLNQPITIKEFDNYVYLIRSYMFYTKQVLEQHNASQHPNISVSVPNASIPNVQPLSRDAPFPAVRVPNRGESMQSTMPRPTSTIQNINQQQLFSNSPQASHSRQSTSNIRQQYMCCVSSATCMPNANQQQSLRNTNYLVQDQYMPSRDMSNVGIQQVFANTSNVLSPNTNMRSCELANQRNVNVPPATNRQSQMMLKNTINTTIAANAQQQKQMYFQTSQINSGTICSPLNFTVTNPDAPRTNAAVENVRHDTSVNQWQACRSRRISQGSSERAQYNCYSNTLNPNKLHVFASEPAHCNVQTYSIQNIQPDQNMKQILQHKLKRRQCLVQPSDISVCSIDLTTNSISQNMPQNVSNKGAEIPKSQNKDHMQEKASSTNLQQELRKGSSACNTSESTSGITPETSTTQRVNILQNMFKPTLSRDKAILILKSTPSQTNKIPVYDLTILTDIQKILLRDQIYAYFLMSDQLKYSLNKQELEQIHCERIILLFLFQNLYDYIKNIIRESQTTEKCVGKDSQDNTSQNRSALQRNTMQTDKLTKIQSTRDNEKSSVCDKNLEKQSLKQSIDSNTSKNSKPTTVENNLEVRNGSFFTPESAMIKEPLTKDVQQEQNNDTSKKEFQKSSLINTEKLSESTLSGHSRTPEENPIAEVSTKNSEIETQDSRKIKEPLKASSSEHSRPPEENLITEVSAKNSEAQNNAKINESLKAASSHDNQSPELCSLAKSAVDLSQEALTEKMEEQPEITNCNEEEKSNNVEAENIRETYNVATLNNDRGNDAESRSPCNTEDRSTNVSNTGDQISSENVQNEMRDDVNEDCIEILDSTEVQFDSSNTRDLVSTSSNVWRSPKIKDEPMEISQVHTQEETRAEIMSECTNAQREDHIHSTNEQSNNFTEKTYNEMLGSSVKLYIDESVEELQKQEQYNKVSSSEEDNLSTLQDSSSDAIKCDSTKVMSLSLLKNMVEVTDTCQDFVTEQNAGMLKEEPEAKEILLEESLKFDDEWNMGENTIQTFGTIKKSEEDSKQSLLEEILKEMPLKFEVEKNAQNTEESATRSIYILPEDIEEEDIEINIHRDIKTIDEQLEYVSEQKYYGKSRISSCNSVQKDNPVDTNVEVLAKNDLNDDIECISVESNDSEVIIMPSILNIRSISPTLFQRMEHVDKFLQSDLELLNEEDGKSLDVNDNLGIPDETDDKPCLRCKRKSIVYCQACLEAHYCSKRCSSLHWNAEHYKQCKGRNSIICIDENIV